MTEERGFHQAELPSEARAQVLSGHAPPDPLVGWRSSAVQVLYNNTDAGWSDGAPHAHQEADEIFVVLRGQIVVEVHGVQKVVGPRAFCCFPKGLFHAIVEVRPPVETIMIRAPSADDKLYRVVTP